MFRLQVKLTLSDSTTLIHVKSIEAATPELAKLSGLSVPEFEIQRLEWSINRRIELLLYNNL